jgi:hypothetical protein
MVGAESGYWNPKISTLLPTGASRLALAGIKIKDAEKYFHGGKGGVIASNWLPMPAMESRGSGRGFRICSYGLEAYNVL